MKFGYLLPGLLLLLASCRQSARNPGSASTADSVEKIIISINDQMIAAQGDTVNGPEKYITYCTDSIIASSWSDFSTSPSEVAHDLGSGVKIKPHDITFRLYDNAAILSYLETSYELFGTDTLFHPLRVTKTFVYHQRQWKMASVVNVALPINYVKPNPEKQANLKDIPGIYQWKSGQADTLAIINGKLYSHMTGESREFNFPISDSEYMIRNDLGRVIFTRDNAGKVIGYTYRNYDGQQIHVRKVK